MKIFSSIVLVTIASVSSAGAFCPLSQNRVPNPITSLQASKEGGWLGPAATAVVGWTLATQIASAGLPASNEHVPSFQGESTTMMIAAEKLDFSLPSSYSTNMGGFGEGTEARLTEAKGGDEGEKQKEAMRKAEAARQARLKEKREAFKAREAEELARAKARKAAQADRVKEIFQ